MSSSSSYDISITTFCVFCIDSDSNCRIYDPKLTYFAIASYDIVLLIAGLFLRQIVSKTPNHSRLRLSEAGSLFIDHVKSTDAGRYTCRATSGSAADVTTRLTVYNASAKLVLQTVGSNFVSVTWQGLDSTIASTHYAILYRHRDEYHPKPSSTSGCFHAV